MPGEMRDDFEAAIEQLTEAPDGKPAGEVVGEAREITNTSITDDGAGDSLTSPKIESKDTLPADGEQKKEVVKEGEQTPAPAVADKAPASWKVEEREEWGKLSSVAKAAVIRRERQVDEALRTSAQAREFTQQFEKTITPFQHYIAAEMSTPLQAVENMFRTASVLNSAPPGHKANEVANMIVHFGVDLAMLDRALTARIQGRQMPTAPQDIVMQQLDNKLRPVMEFMERLQGGEQQVQENLRAEVANEWDTFAAKPENEFADEVREDIADILELAAKRGQALDLQAAYARATMAHPTISKILEQRKLSGSVAQQTAAARRARQAAASVGSDTPSRDSGSDPSKTSLREDLAAAMGQLSGSRT